MSLKPKVDVEAEARTAGRNEGRQEGYQDGLAAGIESGKSLMLVELLAAAPWPHKGWLKNYAERRNNAKRQY